jgi:hypothetical protein
MTLSAIGRRVDTVGVAWSTDYQPSVDREQSTGDIGVTPGLIQVATNR